MPSQSDSHWCELPFAGFEPRLGMQVRLEKSLRVLVLLSETGCRHERGRKDAEKNKNITLLQF